MKAERMKHDVTTKVRWFSFLQAGLLVGAVEARVSSREEEPVGVIRAVIKAVDNHRGVV